MEKAVKENLKEIAKKKGLSFQEAFDYVFDKVSRHLVRGALEKKSKVKSLKQKR